MSFREKWFIQDCRRWYSQIIARAKSDTTREKRRTSDPLYVCYERHHILPRSLFPNWKKRKSNIVLLTPREHYICHKLLYKIFCSKEMTSAWHYLACIGHKKGFVSSRDYQRAKEEESKLNLSRFRGRKHSEESKAKIGAASSQYWKDPEFRNAIVSKTTGKKRTAETKALQSESAKKSWTEERHKKAKETYGHPVSERHKQTLRALRIGARHMIKDGKGKLVPASEIQKYLNEGWRFGIRPFSEETKRRMSESAKRRTDRRRGPNGCFIKTK